MFLAVLAVALAAAGPGLAQIPTSRCPSVTLASNFSIPNYFRGRWYEQRRFPLLFEAGQKCVTADYSLGTNGMVTVVNSGYHVIARKRLYSNGTAYCDGNQRAYCHVRFSSSMPFGDYKVLATDYNNYALVYSCKSFIFFNTQSAWILTRQKFPPQQLIAKANSIFKQNGVDTLYFITTLQDCPGN